MTSTPHAVRTLHLDVGDRPFLVIWELTRSCELVCRHCRAESVHHRHPLELSTDEGKALLDDLAGYGPPRPIVVLTGGDPFERDDLAELVAHGHRAGLTMALAPSVTPRLTRDALVELRAAGASAVSLSLDGATAATHDAFRGIDGVWAATIEAAGLVRDVGFRLQVNTTVTRDNVVELPAIARRVADLGAGLWSVFFLVPTGRGEHLPTLLADEVEQVLWWLAEIADRLPVKTTEAPHFRRVVLQRMAGAPAPGGPLLERLRAATDLGPVTTHGARPPLGVNAGKGFVFVDHLGNVQPSGFLPLSVGSIRQQPLSAIYRTAPLLLALRDPAAFTGRCGRCEFRDVCGGSRSHAYAVTGDPLGDDPTCVHVPRP